MAEFLDSLDAAVARMLERLPAALHVGAPLGLGKPHRLLNALYARIAADPSRPLTLYTALSLDPPRASPGLEQRFLDPFAERHFGADFPRLAYVDAQRRDALRDAILERFCTAFDQHTFGRHADVVDWKQFRCRQSAGE